MKITLATFKKFIKNPDCQIKVCSSFDSSTDCCQTVKDEFSPLSKTDNPHENNFGYSGIWCVFGSRDHFSPYSKNGFEGIEVYNSCGHFIVATKNPQ